MLLKGKTAIITGASKGIGKACAQIFAKNGSNLYLLSRNLEKLEKLKQELSIYDVKITCLSVDVSDNGSINDGFKMIRKDKVVIDVLVNNAGIMEDAVLQMAAKDLVGKIYTTNVFGLIESTKKATKLMIKNRKGSIINLSSIIGTKGNHGQSIYGSSKAAVIGFTKSMSKELAPLNIRVNALAPGFIDTDMTKSMDDKYYLKNIESIGMKRIGKPEDVAKVALFLASDLSEYVTGQIIGIDGGMIV
jgi:3-oxoacyl-[acyl-carrier protein] reductase